MVENESMVTIDSSRRKLRPWLAVKPPGGLETILPWTSGSLGLLLGFLRLVVAVTKAAVRRNLIANQLLQL